MNRTGSTGDEGIVRAVGDHIEEHVGPIDVVFHELASDDLHIDVYHVRPDGKHPYHTLVTSGMSAMAMNTAADAAAFRYAELSILLSPSWDVSQDRFVDEGVYWPVRLLKMLTRYPFENDTWLGYGHTISTAHPPKPFAPATELAACVILPPFSLGEPFFKMDRPDGEVTCFWSIVPLYPDELELKMAKGIDALMDAMDKAGVDDVVKQSRPHALAGKRWLGLF